VKIKARYFWDGLVESIKENVTITIKDKYIAKIESNSSSKVDYSIDGLVMPGLIDAHVHILLDGSEDPISSYLNSNIIQLTMCAYDNLRKQITNGVTFVRDMGSSHEIDFSLEQMKRNDLPGIFPCGHNLVMPKGHGFWIGKEVNGPEEARSAAKDMIGKGAKHLKLMATGGIMTKGTKPGAPELSPQEIAAICDEAHKKNLKVSAHAQGNVGIINALTNGVDIIEHGFELDQKAIELLLDKKGAFTPTFAAANGILDHKHIESLQDSIKKMLSQMENHLLSYKRALENKVTILAGTDAGTPFNEHGQILKEIGYLIENGANHWLAFKAATSTASETLGLAKRGVLIEKSFADIVAFDTNIVTTNLDPNIKPILVLKEGSLI